MEVSICLGWAVVVCIILFMILNNGRNHLHADSWRIEILDRGSGRVLRLMTSREPGEEGELGRKKECYLTHISSSHL